MYTPPIDPVFRQACEVNQLRPPGNVAPDTDDLMCPGHIIQRKR